MVGKTSFAAPRLVFFFFILGERALLSLVAHVKRAQVAVAT